MTKTKIIFRADGSSEIGLGHVIRSLALADMLNEEFECEFATRFVSDFVSSEIYKACSYLHKLPENDNEHYDVFLSLLTGNEIVVLDNYFYPTEYQQQIKDKGCKLVCIDDIHDKHYVADVVINHAPGLDKNNFSVEPYTKLCLGLDYVLLRKPFLEKPIAANKEIKYNKVFICFGGADKNNITLKTIDSIESIQEIKEVNVVVGSSYQFHEELNQRMNKYKKTINIFKSIDALSLRQLIRDADFAIIPCSSILLEVISQNTPAISGFYVDNQLNISKSLVGKYNSINIIGNFNSYKITSKDIYSLNTDTLSINIEPQKNHLKNFLRLKQQMQFVLSEATVTDSELLFEWVNNKTTRENAFNTKPITHEEHNLWYNRKLSDKNCYIFICYIKSIPIGQVRFDIYNKECIIDYSIAPEHRGKKYSVPMLNEAIYKIIKLEKANINTITAEVKNSNQPSLSVFEQLQFHSLCVDLKITKFTKKIEHAKL